MSTILKSKVRENERYGCTFFVITNTINEPLGYATQDRRKTSMAMLLRINYTCNLKYQQQKQIKSTIFSANIESAY